MQKKIMRTQIINLLHQIQEVAKPKSKIITASSFLKIPLCHIYSLLSYEHVNVICSIVLQILLELE
jgi:hypothetical protein